MASSAARTFSEALADRPMRLFQWVTVCVCMLILICDGIDLQLLGIVAPLVIGDFAVDKGTFGIAMSAALIGFGFGAWGGGKFGDTVGRRLGLAVAAAIFALATMGASHAGDVWSLAAWRIVGGLGFGAAYANAIAVASEWLPDRLRPVTVSTLSVGTPIGGTIVGWLGPALAADHGWRGAFFIFGSATLLLVLIILATVRDSPSFFLARGKTVEARQAARRVLDEDVELVAESHEHSVEADGPIETSRTGRRSATSVGLIYLLALLGFFGVYELLVGQGVTRAHAALAAGLMLLVASFFERRFLPRLGSRSQSAAVGVLHRSNLRFNIGVGIAFAACALCAYGILNWSTTFLTAKGFTLAQAGNAVSVGGITSMLASVIAGIGARLFGTRRVMAVVSGTLVIVMIALGFAVETLPAVPGFAERVLVVSLVGLAAAIFSAGMATMYVIMVTGYPPACRSAGIGFGIFMSRVGAISASAFGGTVLELGHGSVLPFFGVLTMGALLISAAAIIVDRHLPPKRARGV